jgi:hypothetical protein
MLALRKSYSGEITLLPGVRGQTFYFMMLNPYGGTEAEFAIYNDEGRTIPLVEGVGEESVESNPVTGLPVTNFDFSIDASSPIVGVTFVLATIISEAIWHLEQMHVAGKAELGKPIEFNHVWEQNFEGRTLPIAESFRKNFGVA